MAFVTAAAFSPAGLRRPRVALRAMRRLLPAMRRLLRACALAAAAIGAAHAQPAARVGAPAPPFEATLLDGRRVTLEAFAGKVLLVNFWATWCAPCRAEMPALEAYRAAHGAAGFEVLAISVDRPQDRDAVVDALRGYGFHAAMSRDARFGAWGRVWRMPTTFVVDRGGVLRLNGATGEPVVIDATMLEREVTPLLAAPAR